MIEGSDNELAEACFPELCDKDAKRVLAVAVMLEKRYKNPNLERFYLILETYISIKTGKRKFNESHEYVNFIINSMRSIANNEIRRMHNNYYKNDNEALKFLPCDYDSPEERLNKESEIKAIFKALYDNDSLIEMAKSIFIENTTSINELSEKLGITIDQIKYLKKKIILLAKNNISKIDQK